MKAARVNVHTCIIASNLRNDTADFFCLVDRDSRDGIYGRFSGSCAHKAPSIQSEDIPAITADNKGVRLS
jgi:hypothetical protein